MAKYRITVTEILEVEADSEELAMEQHQNGDVEGVYYSTEIELASG